MASLTAVKKFIPKIRKNREQKIHLVFDEDKRRDFLTGFHKRKLQRKKDAKKKLEQDLKEERKRLKAEAKESYKKLVVSHRPIPELETLLKEEYEEDDVTVKVEELSTVNIANKNNFIGANQPRYESEAEENDEGIEGEEVPGMELKGRKSVGEKKVKREFQSEKDVKKLLKKEATKKVKKSKVFQMKNKMEKIKQRKKSQQLRKQNLKVTGKKSKKVH